MNALHPGHRGLAPYQSILIHVLLLAGTMGTSARTPEIIFVSDRSGGREIWKIKIEPGAQPERLTTGANAYYPSWSTRNEIIYQSGSAGHLVLRNSDGSIIPLSSVAVPNRQSLQEEYPSWSPDGNLIAYVRRLRRGTSTWYRDIWVRSTAEPATTASDVAVYGSAQGVEIDTLLWTAWSPDGKRIAFTKPYANADIFVAEMDRSGPTPVLKNEIRLTSSSASDTAPCWSPDGKWIAFQSGRSGGIDIYRMSSTLGESDTNNFVRLTSNPANDRNPAWSPDGKTIAFVSDRDGNREIYLMSASDGELGTNALIHLAASSGTDENPSWRPAPDLLTNSISWSASQGGVDFRYEVRGVPLDVATTAKLFWANGTTANDIIPTVTPIFTNDIPSGTFGSNAIINVPASQFTNPPSGATYLLLALDHDNLVEESDKGNNLTGLPMQELVDAVNFQQAGVLPSDPSYYFSGGQLRVGAVADGASRLVLRFHLGTIDLSDPALNLHFAISGGGSQGRLRPLNSDTSSFDVRAALATQWGITKALCIYESPVDFPSPTTTATVQLLNGTTVLASREIRLRRPPVVLVHGTFSSPCTWTALPPKLRALDYSVDFVDYKTTHSAHFSTNIPKIYAGIRHAIEGCQAAGYAASQVDLVAHSMGGVLSRLHIQSGSQQAENYLKGDVHKLITLGATHWGSFWAGVAQGVKTCKPSIYSIIRNVVFLTTHFSVDLDGGAAEDQVPGSRALLDLRTTTNHCHAFASSLAIAPDGTWLQDPFVSMFFLFSIGVIGDGVVSTDSARGGIDSHAYSFNAGLLHTMLTTDDNIASQVVQLLQAPVGSPNTGEFAFFPPSAIAPSDAAIMALAYSACLPSPEWQTPASPSPFPLANRMADPQFGHWLEVSGLTNGASSIGGQHLVITVGSIDGRQMSSALFITPQGSLIDSTPPFQAEFVMPADALGSQNLVIIGKDLNGEMSLLDFSLNVGTTSTLQRIEVIPPALPIRTRLPESLQVFGHFSDGVNREITSDSTGTTYTSSDISRLSVDTNGMLSALQSSAIPITVWVTNGTVWGSVQITVDLLNIPPTAVIIADKAGGFAPLVIDFDGTQSRDAETMPLTYRWDFGDGTTSDLPTPRHTFSAPRNYVVRLVVSDPGGLNGSTESLFEVAPAIRLNIGRSNGFPRITLFGDPAIQHILEGSTNLQDWIPLATNSPSGGSFEYVDSNFTGVRQQFYRGRKP